MVLVSSKCALLHVAVLPICVSVFCAEVQHIQCLGGEVKHQVVHRHHLDHRLVLQSRESIWTKSRICSTATTVDYVWNVARDRKKQARGTRLPHPQSLDHPIIGILRPAKCAGCP